MRRRLPTAIALATLVLAAAPVPAALFAHSYRFKGGVILEIGEGTEDGLRIDNVRFDVPSKVSGQVMRAGGLYEAEVAVSNTGTAAAKIGLAIALFDEAGNLLAAASGGSKLASIKPGRQKSFTLVFDGVHRHAERAATFQIAIETGP